MKTDVLCMQYGSAASFGDAADALRSDMARLGEHLSSCKKQYGRLSGLRCLAQRVHGFVNAHFVTTLVLLMLVANLRSLFL
jgi:hypothetical protein